MKKLLMLFVVLNLLSCTEEKNSKRYYYLLMDDAVDMGYPFGSIVYKSTQKNSYEDVLIYSDVERYESDSRYILVEQRPNKKIMEENVKNKLNFWSTDYIENRKDTVINVFGDKMSIKNINNMLAKHSGNNLQHVSDSIIQNNALLKNIFKNKVNYYLIDKKSDCVYGPMNRDELSKIMGRKGVTLAF